MCDHTCVFDDAIAHTTRLCKRGPCIVCAQVFERSVRMGIGGCTRLFVLSEARLTDIIGHVLRHRPTAVVIDSINTM